MRHANFDESLSITTSPQMHSTTCHKCGRYWQSATRPFPVPYVGGCCDPDGARRQLEYLDEHPRCEQGHIQTTSTIYRRPKLRAQWGCKLCRAKEARDRYAAGHRRVRRTPWKL
jgi:hypothetical protein